MIGKSLLYISVVILLMTDCSVFSRHNNDEIFVNCFDIHGSIIGIIGDGVFVSESHESIPLYFMSPSDSIIDYIRQNYGKAFPDHTLNEVLWHFILFENNHPSYSTIVFFSRQRQRKHNPIADTVLESIGKRIKADDLPHGIPKGKSRRYVVMFQFRYW